MYSPGNVSLSTQRAPVSAARSSVRFRAPGDHLIPNALAISTMQPLPSPTRLASPPPMIVPTICCHPPTRMRPPRGSNGASDRISGPRRSGVAWGEIRPMRVTGGDAASDRRLHVDGAHARERPISTSGPSTEQPEGRQRRRSRQRRERVETGLSARAASCPVARFRPKRTISPSSPGRGQSDRQAPHP